MVGEVVMFVCFDVWQIKLLCFTYDIIGWLRFIKQKKALVYYKDDDDWTAVEFIVNNKH